MELHCGNLKMQYQKGFLRWIKAGEDEVLRMIYFALRDKNWNTMHGKIISEDINQQADHFSISYEMLIEEKEVKMQWWATIQGNADNTIDFTLRGKVLSRFEKNRAGFCVLHPIRECAGKEVLIKHDNGTIEGYLFPVYISPHQPFKNISAMEWRLQNNTTVNLQFEGDVFETEDQRNWTDYSFKTYSTPLNLPFPVTMHPGDEISQSVRIRVEGAKYFPTTPDNITITAGKDIFPVPSIGVSRSSERNNHYQGSLEFLSAIGFSHYRSEIRLSLPAWEQTFHDCIRESGWIKAPLEIALFVSDDTVDGIRKFIDIAKKASVIKQIILLEENAGCMSNALLKKVFSQLSSSLNHVLIGSGTDHYFTALNRSDLDTSMLDFVSYSMNPQVHASDDISLIENLEGQAATVKTALYKYGKPVHVTPVTLKTRYNTDAKEKSDKNLPSADERQQTPFNAAWTLGSLKYLIESGVSSITYFETEGIRGLISDNKNFKTFPVLELFKAICGKDVVYIRKCTNSHPLSCNAIIMRRDELEFLMIANHTHEAFQVDFINITMEKISLQVKALEIATYNYSSK